MSSIHLSDSHHYRVHRGDHQPDGALLFRLGFELSCSASLEPTTTIEWLGGFSVVDVCRSFLKSAVELNAEPLVASLWTKIKNGYSKHYSHFLITFFYYLFSNIINALFKDCWSLNTKLDIYFYSKFLFYRDFIRYIFKQVYYFHWLFFLLNTVMSIKHSKDILIITKTI